LDFEELLSFTQRVDMNFPQNCQNKPTNQILRSDCFVAGTKVLFTSKAYKGVKDQSIRK